MEVKKINIIRHLFKEKPSHHGEYLLKHVIGIQRHNRKDKYHNGMDIINAADTCSLKKDKEATFLCIADTHGMLLYDKSKLMYEIEQKGELDAVITLGDIRKDELYIICDTVAGGMPVYGVKGNHDDEDQFDSKNIMDINGHMVYINNVSIMHGWQHKVQYTQEESLEFAKTLQGGADILFSHSHAWRKDDKRLGKYDIHTGLYGTRYYMDHNDCISIHGHDHISTEMINNREIRIYGIHRITYCNGKIYVS